MTAASLIKFQPFFGILSHIVIVIVIIVIIILNFYHLQNEHHIIFNDPTSILKDVSQNHYALDLEYIYMEQISLCQLQLQNNMQTDSVVGMSIPSSILT